MTLPFKMSTAVSRLSNDDGHLVTITLDPACLGLDDVASQIQAAAFDIRSLVLKGKQVCRVTVTTPAPLALAFEFDYLKPSTTAFFRAQATDQPSPSFHDWSVPTATFLRIAGLHSVLPYLRYNLGHDLERQGRKDEYTLWTQWLSSQQVNFHATW